MTSTLSYPFYIAEVAQAHEGSLGIAHSFIDALADTGVHAIKFQTHIAQAESSDQEPFRIKFSYEDKTRYNYWKRMEFTLEQWVELKGHCEERGLIFMSSPFSLAAVDLLESINCAYYKIGSGEVSNLLLLEKLAATGKLVILSSGMSGWDELDRSVAYLKERNALLAVLQCTTAYPTQPHQWGLNVISLLRSRYDCTVGFSDHSGDIYAPLAAVALGAQILEFHVCFDKRMFGPDAKASLTPDQVSQLVTGANQVAESLQTGIDKNNIAHFDELKKMFGKSLAVNKRLPKGHRVGIEDLETKKPAGSGIAADNFNRVIGKTLKKDLEPWQFLTEDHLTEL